LSNLELSERSYFNPNEFCFAFKEFDGTPTKIGEQKDAEEFFNLFVDWIETAIKNNAEKYVPKEIFGGKFCIQKVCSECGYESSWFDDYMNIKITMKDTKSLAEGLQKYIEGEIINEYNCQGCNKKVDAKNRTLISSTPNVLLF